MLSALHACKVRRATTLPSSPLRTVIRRSITTKLPSSTNKIILEDLIAKNVTSKRFTKSDATSRFWSYRKKWIHEGTNPFEIFEPKDPDPVPVGKQTNQDQLVAEQELGATRNIRIYIPESYNPINKHLAVRLNNLFAKYEKNKIVTSVTLQGYDQAFCTGMDFAYVYKNRDSEESRAFLKNVYQMAYSAATMAKPLVTIHDGISLGTGNALYLHGSVRVATEKGIFSIRDQEHGWFPDGGITYHLARHPIKGMGMYLALSGATLYGADLCHANLATHYVREPFLKGFRGTLALNYWKPEKLDRFLNSVNDGSEPYIDKEYTQLAHLPLIEKCFAKDTLPEIIQALKDDGSGWASNCLSHIYSCDPVSVLITFRLMKLAETSTMDKVIKAEYAIAQELLKHRDLYEGIECTVLNDPPRVPKWRFASISSVPKSEIDKYFNEKGKDTLDLVALSDHPIRNIIAERMEEILQDSQEDVRLTKEEFQLRQRISPLMLKILTPAMETLDEEGTELMDEIEEKGDLFMREVEEIVCALLMRKSKLVYSLPQQEAEEMLMAYRLPADEAAKKIAKLRQVNKLYDLKFGFTEVLEQVGNINMARVYKLAQLPEDEILKYAHKEILEVHLTPISAKQGINSIKTFINNWLKTFEFDKIAQVNHVKRQGILQHYEDLQKADAELEKSDLPQWKKKLFLLTRETEKFEEKFAIELNAYAKEKAANKAKSVQEYETIFKQSIEEYQNQTRSEREKFYFNYFKQFISLLQARQATLKIDHSPVDMEKAWKHAHNWYLNLRFTDNFNKLLELKRSVLQELDFLDSPDKYFTNVKSESQTLLRDALNEMDKKLDGLLNSFEFDSKYLHIKLPSRRLNDITFESFDFEMKYPQLAKYWDSELTSILEVESLLYNLRDKPDQLKKVAQDIRNVKYEAADEELRKAAATWVAGLDGKTPMEQAGAQLLKAVKLDKLYENLGVEISELVQPDDSNPRSLNASHGFYFSDTKKKIHEMIAAETLKFEFEGETREFELIREHFVDILYPLQPGESEANPAFESVFKKHERKVGRVNQVPERKRIVQEGGPSMAELVLDPKYEKQFEETFQTQKGLEEIVLPEQGAEPVAEESEEQVVEGLQGRREEAELEEDELVAKINVIPDTKFDKMQGDHIHPKIKALIEERKDDVNLLPEYLLLQKFMLPQTEDEMLAHRIKNARKDLNEAFQAFRAPGSFKEFDDQGIPLLADPVYGDVKKIVEERAASISKGYHQPNKRILCRIVMQELLPYHFVKYPKFLRMKDELLANPQYLQFLDDIEARMDEIKKEKFNKYMLSGEFIADSHKRVMKEPDNITEESVKELSSILLTESGYKPFKAPWKKEPLDTLAKTLINFDEHPKFQEHLEHVEQYRAKRDEKVLHATVTKEATFNKFIKTATEQTLKNAAAAMETSKPTDHFSTVLREASKLEDKTLESIMGVLKESTQDTEKFVEATLKKDPQYADLHDKYERLRREGELQFYTSLENYETVQRFVQRHEELMQTPELLGKNKEILYAEFVKGLSNETTSKLSYQKFRPVFEKLTQALDQQTGADKDLEISLADELEKDPLDEDMMVDHQKIIDLRKDPDLDLDDGQVVKLDEEDRV